MTGSVTRFVTHTLESCDAVAQRADDLAERVRKHGAASGGRRRNFAVLRTQTALKQTESVLAQTARSLQRTAGALAPVSTPD
jgi:hypothetical protein